jgi:EAL and modified HD-GYP domain-containing signal transduction protein
MERVLVSRQPIYTANMGELGYELLFRNSSTEDRASFTDGDHATANVIVNTFMDIGLEEVVGRYLAFINFDRNLITGNYCECLPPDRVVLEVLETVTPDDELIEKLRHLRSLGYRIALDDFVCIEATSLLEVAHFVKFEVMGNDWDQLERFVLEARKYPVKLIAEKVETLEQFERCKALGFEYFQGYFFSRPQLMQGRRVPVNRLAAIRLIVKLNTPDVDVKGLQDAISGDASLTYKLLSYINSAMYSLTRKITSIGHAVMLVGLHKIKAWASLIVLASVDDKSRDLVMTGAIRARMCEHLANALGLPKPERSFLVGLLSVLDALLDQPIAEVVQSLPLETDIVEAVVNYEGSLGNILKCALEYEKRNWSEAQAAVNLNEETIREAYQKSLAWSLSTLNSVSRSEPVKVAK